MVKKKVDNVQDNCMKSWHDFKRITIPSNRERMPPNQIQIGRIVKLE